MGAVLVTEHSLPIRGLGTSIGIREIARAVRKALGETTTVIYDGDKYSCENKIIRNNIVAVIIPEGERDWDTYGYLKGRLEEKGAPPALELYKVTSKQRRDSQLYNTITAQGTRSTADGLEAWLRDKALRA